MSQHIEITGRALAILWRQFREWEHTIAWIAGKSGSYVSFYRGEPSRLWMPGQFKAVEVML